MTSELVHLTATEASRMLHSGQLSPIELVDAFLARIERVDGRIKSYLLVDADGARAKARAAEAEIRAGRWRGPLHGIPYAVKDTFYTKGLRTCANSRVLLDMVPYYDAAFPHSTNPWKDNYFTGGSSTGAGAAVAAGTTVFALGADTGGSIRAP